MAFKDSKYGRLILNVGLAFLAGAATAGLALAQTTPKDNLKVFVISVVSGAVVAGARAAVGFLALNIPAVPAVPTDV